MLTVEQVNAGVSALRHRAFLAMGATGLVLLLGLAVAQLTESSWGESWFGWIAIATLFAEPCVVWWLTKRDPRLRCPQCHKSLLACWHKVIATRHCVQCEQRIIVEPKPRPTLLLNPSQPADQRECTKRSGNRAAITAEDLKAGASLHLRRYRIFALVSLVATFMGVSISFMLYGSSGEDSPLVLVPLTPGLVILFVGLSIVNRSLKKDVRIHCPHCRQLLHSMYDWVIATKNCGHCGRRILAEREETGSLGVLTSPPCE